MSSKYPPTGSPMPQVQLSLRQGPLAGQVFSLSTPTIILGRGKGNDVVIDEGQVSRRHASINWDGRQYTLQDLGSANGTFVNGVRLTGPHVLQPGDSIGLGNTVVMGFQSTMPVAAAPPPVPPATAPATATPSRFILPLGIVLGLCLLLAIAGGLAYMYLMQQEPPTRLVVLINDPEQGDEVEVGEAVVVHLVARDQGKVMRVELWADGELVASQSSSLPGGTSPFPLFARWQPTSAGSHTLIARAFSPSGEQGQASITVEAVNHSDRDGDRVRDAEDRCPDEPGALAADGCPDRDGDGIADAEDACPDEAGLPEGDGCPSPGEGDRDGDGVADAADACPDEPGSPEADGCPDRDGDGVADTDDACPDEPGPGDDGCPGSADTDGDGIPDTEDACPDEAGSLAADGCPDRDGDGIPDVDDACPDEAGIPGAPGGDGCPAPADGDRDGDMIPDIEDDCPDEPGPPWTGGCPDRDGDGVLDADDACPGEPGPADSDGCPAPGPGPGPGGGDDGADSDGDGVPDADDDCPGDWGPAETGGCPDRDGDGVLDRDDLCPDIFGLPEHAGCPPPPGDGDRDGDGIPDDVDMCPGEPGLPEHGGCPAPGPGGDDGDDGDDGPIPLWPPPRGVYVLQSVEFQALSFEVSDEYDAVSCYISLAGADRERYEFEPLGERTWDIVAEVGDDGSRHLVVPGDDPLSVALDCGGEQIFLSPGEGWGTYWDLGSAVKAHPPGEWDGHVITSTSVAGDDGRDFEASYRLCTGTCEDAAFPPPMVNLYGDSTGRYLQWAWTGDRDAIDGFKMYVDGNYIYSLRSSLNRNYVTTFVPPCGSEPLEFQLSAFRGDLESPLSNIAYLSVPACSRTVRVTFDALATFDLGSDEWWAHGSSVGPIHGNFWAQGANDEILRFNATDPGDGWGERDDGFRLRHRRYYLVQDIFDWIQTQLASCIGSICPAYSGPAGNSVEIELGPYDDLTFGAGIYDFDSDNEDETLFENRRTLPAGEIRPGRYRIWDRNMAMEVLIDVLVGPEAGDLPDLTISDVRLAGGEPYQLQVDVFNNAADLVDEAVTLHVVRRSTGETLVHTTYPGASIPSGGSVPLQTSETFESLSDLRIIVDPDNTIEEMNERNNIYESPVTARVEFLEAWAGHCNETTCSILDCDSEHVFHVWAGHGPDASNIEWVGYNVRFPDSGHLVACGNSACEYRESSDEDWRMEGDPRYIFDFDFPANENLYVMVTGEELDWGGVDDSLGRVFREYMPEVNYGAGSGVPASQDHYGNYGEETPCSESSCEPCPEGLHAWWRIVRIE